MTKHTITIDVPEGFVVEHSNSEIKIKEKLKAPKDRIKTEDDILADHGMTREQFDDKYAGYTEDEAAYVILKMLAKSLNEGWTPDWNNANQAKYYPWFEMGGSSGFRFIVCGHRYSLSHVGSRLCFKTSELAVYAGNQFTDLYKQFMK